MATYMNLPPVPPVDPVAAVAAGAPRRRDTEVTSPLA